MRIRFIFFSIFFFSYLYSGNKINLTEHEKNRILIGEQIIRRVGGENKKNNSYEAVALIKATVDEISSILLDFRSYPEYMPNVAKIEIKSQSGSDSLNESVVDYVLGLPLRKVKKYRLFLMSEKKTEEFKQSWKMIDWPDLENDEKINDTSGFWHVTDFPQKKGHVLVVYHVYTDPGDVPWGLGWIISHLTEKRLPRVIIALEERVEKIYR